MFLGIHKNVDFSFKKVAYQKIMQFATICKFTLTNLQSNLYMHIYQINIKVPDSNFWLKIIGQNLKSKLKNHKKQILWVLFICRVYWISNRTSNWAFKQYRSSNKYKTWKCGKNWNQISQCEQKDHRPEIYPWSMV